MLFNNVDFVAVHDTGISAYNLLTTLKPLSAERTDFIGGELEASHVNYLRLIVLITNDLQQDPETQSYKVHNPARFSVLSGTQLVSTWWWIWEDWVGEQLQ